jgi:hypothetical protein
MSAVRDSSIATTEFRSARKKKDHHPDTTCQSSTSYREVLARVAVLKTKNYLLQQQQLLL